MGSGHIRCQQGAGVRLKLLTLAAASGRSQLTLLLSRRMIKTDGDSFSFSGFKLYAGGPLCTTQ